MKIEQISPQQAADYVNCLKSLIESTIELPQAAIDHFKGQWSPEGVAENADKWLFLLATEKDDYLGLVLGTPPEGGVATIIWLLVDPKKQQRGVGQQLFAKATEIYKQKGAHKVKLTVPKESIVEFYTKQGMTIEGVHRNHWWNQDFWAMGISL
ncbi:MAG: GNAT family N-acetyltransferase [Cryomorphaceae bacterium]